MQALHEREDVRMPQGNNAPITIHRVNRLLYVPDSVIGDDGETYTVLFTDGHYMRVHTRATLLSIIADLQRSVDHITEEDITVLNRDLEQEHERAREVIREQRRSRPEKPKVTYKGFVYILHGGSQYKIGCTKHPTIRPQAIARQMPFAVEIVLLIPSQDMYETERRIHTLFSAKRIEGEWFSLAENDIAHLRSLYECVEP